ncbi:MAG: class I SAM-dependent methyltransferase [Myxacorys californica WJT36-NPBG1]|jgi:ubiquinone/menaquinone biosynthesis C-methylase UbiE|nr:class I SAM-dependent methyltransferase [Myxacorys californica WJT36-NPBG1]
MNILQKEQIEIEFWKNSPVESPKSEAVENLVSKFCEAKIFLEKLDYHQHHFRTAQRILEIGAGQGWASCFLKRKFPEKYVIASDISQYAIASASKWEYVLKTTLDEKLQCRAYDIPLADESIDLIFCFESAHHFVKYRKTLEEVHRVLKKGGVCLYLHEPACKQYLYKLAYARVNRKRPEVPEDVLIYDKIQQLAEQAGLETQIRFDPSTLNRGAVETIYYFLLQKLPPLRSSLPCSVDFLFKKI